MKSQIITAASLLLSVQLLQAQAARIEPCDCPVKIDSSFQTQCGYLVVPENRKKQNGKTIRLPFVVVKSKNVNKRKDPVLFTGGGPGGSSLGWARNTQRTLLENRDCIAFEQRGTNFALPNLWSNELSGAIRESYRKNLHKDSMIIEGTKRYKRSLEAKGIDLSGYNTDETVADIHDLIKTLQIDSVNLFGISYSGGLMLAVLKKDPSRIRSLILDSPLPTFVPIDEEEPNNFNEALNTLFQYCDKDSADKRRYGNLKEKFRNYFSSIGGKSFQIPYVEKGKTDTLVINYTRGDLLNIIVNAFYEQNHIKDIAYMITEIMAGKHEPYIRPVMDHIFNRSNGPSGMRISVYCADQATYHNESVLRLFYNVYPWLEGYHINDVFKEMCECWDVPPVAAETKQPFYSDKPVLLADGALDPACRPLYIDRIKHYMTNSQRLLFIKRSHGVLGGQVGDAFIRKFLDNPFKKVDPLDTDIIAY